MCVVTHLPLIIEDSVVFDLGPDVSPVRRIPFGFAVPQATSGTTGTPGIQHNALK